MICIKPMFAGLNSNSWNHYQKPFRSFTSSAIAQSELDPQVLKTLHELDSITHIHINTYASLLQACALSKALPHARHVHHHIMTHGHGAHNLLGFLILEMYCKCGAVEDATAWFAIMPSRSVCAWNHMIGLYSRHGHSVRACHLFNQMLQEGMLADKITCISMISVYTILNSLEQGKKMNACIVGSGFELQVVVVTALINLYGKCGDPDRALLLFDTMPRRDTITWSALISGYKQNRQGKEALQFFDQMLMEGVLASRAIFACTLSACTTQVSLCQGKRMHVYIVQNGFEAEYVVSNALVRMYSQCGSLEVAQQLFDHLSSVNMVASNAMLAAYAQHGCLKDAVKLLAKMQHEGMPVDMICYIHMLEVCGKKAALIEGKQMHAYIRRSGYEGVIVVGNALVSMYGRCQSLEDAQKVFEKMPNKDVVSWNAIISAYAQNGDRKAAMQIFDQMQQAGMIPNKVTFICVLDAVSSQADLLDTRWFHARIQLSDFHSDVIVATTLINMHGKTGSLISAHNTFDMLREPNVVSWTAMISAHSFNNQDKEALQIFEQMLQQGVIPDVVTFLNTIGACTSLAALREGKIMHARVLPFVIESELAAVNGLVNMYGKCGDLEASWRLFDRTHTRNLATWNVMISTYAQHGIGNEAFTLLERMQQEGLAPDRVTYVTYLSACSHAGLANEAFGCLLRMTGNDFGAPPVLEHYDCIVDLLGRAGRLHEAQTVVNVLPFQPSPLSWMTLLTVCRNVLDVERGKHAAKHVVEVDSEDHVPYIMLANIYSAVGREEDAESLLSLILNQEELLLEGNQRQPLDEEGQDSFGILLGCS